MSSVSRVTANEPARATARAGSGTGSGSQDAEGNGHRGEGISIGVILGFPEAIAEELQRWRASFGDPMAGVIPAHITLVTTTTTRDWDATRNHVRAIASRQEPFHVTIAGTGSFRPVSPVVFLNVEDGFGDCVSLHERLQAGPLERELPFEYHPHVTVAHDVAPESLDEAETALKDYRATFPVASMGLYEHDQNGIWQLREELDFGTEFDIDRGEDGAPDAR
ncbi:2'-5' RNA ligase family protein [Arthrobacter sp. AL08]|uniref:2'-5' RNA ligase family protein n=1 Tax=unclassified Arthrobacter TaxID=235627 RepID=UPI00249AE692|nr:MULTISPECIES: 2'-5' RNA ligase family protein [unclassified Arthrobacter]MDI3240468.1 2'-5' RNA ligase family protein [Arthrobacter sp. AL05]MDI3276478.1 2'-5' RNA ligase family protein [Arthrobacter sp. AL08]